jgi:NAD(P)-dependent dehydrogenase (short-subunit alcohol dehydrogenase family)
METLCRLSYGGAYQREARGYTVTVQGPKSLRRTCPPPARIIAACRGLSRLVAARRGTLLRAAVAQEPRTPQAGCMPAHRWTTQDIPDLTGLLAIVTGANSGLGLETARELARAGAGVVMACRNPVKAQEALTDVRRTARDPEAVVTTALDLADLSSVHAFASDITSAVDLLVNNAGIMAIPRSVSADGHEMQLATNHLGHFALTGLLLPRLQKAPKPRVVTVSSQMHRVGKIDFDDLMGERNYNPWRAYGQSKLANLLFTSELARRAGASLTATAAHPGWSATNLQGVAPQMAGDRLRAALTDVGNRLIGQSAAMGALPTLHAALVDLPTDTYVGPSGPFEQRGHPKVVGRSAAAHDPHVARRLWEESERLTGVSYAFTT